MRIEIRTIMGLRRGMEWSLGAVLLLGGCSTEEESTPRAEIRSIEDPPSLEGVDIDGALTPSPSGHVVLDVKARTLFDHFLAAEGEVDEADLHGRVRAEIDRRLQGSKAEDAWALFLAYVDYRREATELLQGIDPEELVARPEVLTNALAEIRARTVGDAPGVADDEKRLRAALDIWEELSDPSTEAEVRGQHVAALQLQMGEALDPAAPSRILSRIHAALAEISPDDVEARRAALLGIVDEAAAERWLALERRRARL